jgi:transposase
MSPDPSQPVFTAAPANWRELMIGWQKEREAWQKEREAWQIEREAWQKERANLLQQIEMLTSQVKYLTRQLYGKKSERFTAVKPNEVLLPGFEAGHLATEADFAQELLTPSVGLNAKRADSPARRKSAGRPQFIFPPNCPIIEREITPAEVLAQPKAYRKIREQQTELLHITPALFSKLVIKRAVYVPIDKDPTEPRESIPLIAPLPTLQEDSHLSASVLAYIISSKYADHLPYYRQEQIYQSRHGISLPRQTMCRWARMAFEVWLPGILQAIQDAVLSSDVLHIDETPVKYLCPGNTTTKQGYLWVLHAPSIGTHFHWSTSRGASVLAALLPNQWNGHIICDGYGVYEKLRNDRPEKIKLVACLAHVRRKFREARDQDPGYVEEVLAKLQQIYDVEARLARNKASRQEVLSLRQSESRPIYQYLQKRFEHSIQTQRYLPQSRLGRAHRYTLDQWADLLPVLEHGHLPVDNNPVERAIRPTAVGKKNYLFFGPGECGQVSAGYYSLIGTAKMHGLDPFKYLEELFEALPSLKTPQHLAWLPAAYSENKPKQPLSYKETHRPAEASRIKSPALIA